MRRLCGRVSYNEARKDRRQEPTRSCCQLISEIAANYKRGTGREEIEPYDRFQRRQTSYCRLIAVPKCPYKKYFIATIKTSEHTVMIQNNATRR